LESIWDFGLLQNIEYLVGLAHVDEIREEIFILDGDVQIVRRRENKGFDKEDRYECMSYIVFMKHTTLSKRKRIVYLIISVIIFLILSPLVAYYASGYRFDEKFEVMKTGGIYVVLEGKGFSIYLNDIEQEVSSIFRRDFFIQNLSPGVYSLRVGKVGFQEWNKKIIVTQEKVAGVRPFNLPEKIEPIEIVRKVTQEKVQNKNTKTEATSTLATSTDNNQIATTTYSIKEIENEDYVYVKTLFATGSERIISMKSNASSTYSVPKHVLINKKIIIWASSSEISSAWIGENDNAPVYFCNKEDCLSKISVFKGAKIRTVDFLTDSFVVFATDNGVYVTELDGRGGRNIQPLVLGEKYDFRVVNDEIIYLKKGKQYFKVSISL
jgi:hypothetical protein